MEVEVTKVETHTIKDGDLVVLKSERNIKYDEMKALKRQMEVLLDCLGVKDCSFVVLEGGLSMEVWRKEQGEDRL